MVFIVCSDHARNGKTLLARVLVDFLLLEGRDPFCFDLGHPDPALRQYFPGRTAALDFAQAGRSGRLFDTMLARGGRDYVIDLSAQHLALFCEVAAERNSRPRPCKGIPHRRALCGGPRGKIAQHGGGCGRGAGAGHLRACGQPVGGHGTSRGRAGPHAAHGAAGGRSRHPHFKPALLAPRLHAGGREGVPEKLRTSLKNFLHGLVTGMREFEPALSLQALRETSP